MHLAVWCASHKGRLAREEAQRLSPLLRDELDPPELLLDSPERPLDPLDRRLLPPPDDPPERRLELPDDRELLPELPDELPPELLGMTWIPP